MDQSRASEDEASLLLRDRVAELTRAEARNSALLLVLKAVVWMRAPEDLDAVLAAVRAGLKDAGMRYCECGVNWVVEEPGSSAVVRSRSIASTERLGEKLGEPARSAILDMWRSGATVYRPDLRRQDEYEEEARLSQAFGTAICSVVDVPFSCGTLAVNSTEPDAFTAADIRLLEDIAEMIGQGFLRLRELEQIRATERQLHLSQRLESVGRLAGGVAHDFNNILTVVRLGAEMAGRTLGTGHPSAELLGQVTTAADKGTALVRQLLAFSRRQIMDPVLLDLNEVVLGLEKMLHRLLGEDIALELDLSPDLGRISADPAQLEQVIMNLVVNSRDAMPDGGRITIQTQRVELEGHSAERHVRVEPGPHVLMAVTDTGVGMEPETLEHVFEPFYTTKESGSGLGLATSYGIVKQSNGYIWAYSELGRGTTFKVYLPHAAQGAGAPIGRREPRAPATGSSGGTETVLLVEDDAMLRSLAATVLQEAGYTVLSAACGHDAAVLAHGHRQPIHVVVSDVVMPGLAGRALADRLKAEHPETRVLWMSGYLDERVRREELLQPGEAFLAKPLDRDTLTRKVREVLDDGR